MTTTLRRAARWHRPLMIFTGLMGVTAAVALVGVFVDPRILTGVPIWIKPFKFAISLGIYGLTIAWMLSLLPRRSRVAEWAATVIVAMSDFFARMWTSSASIASASRACVTGLLRHLTWLCSK